MLNPDIVNCQERKENKFLKSLVDIYFPLYPNFCMTSIFSDAVIDELDRIMSEANYLKSKLKEAESTKTS